MCVHSVQNQEHCVHSGECITSLFTVSGSAQRSKAAAHEEPQALLCARLCACLLAYTCTLKVCLLLTGGRSFLLVTSCRVPAPASVCSSHRRGGEIGDVMCGSPALPEHGRVRCENRALCQVRVQLRGALPFPSLMVWNLVSYFHNKGNRVGRIAVAF